MVIFYPQNGGKHFENYLHFEVSDNIYLQLCKNCFWSLLITSSKVNPLFYLNIKFRKLFILFRSNYKQNIFNFNQNISKYPILSKVLLALMKWISSRCEIIFQPSSDSSVSKVAILQTTVFLSGNRVPLNLWTKLWHFWGCTKGYVLRGCWGIFFEKHNFLMHLWGVSYSQVLYLWGVPYSQVLYLWIKL